MRRIFAALTLMLVGFSLAAPAEARERLGYGRIVNNDLWGGGGDRWQTGSYFSSRVWGPEWTGALPEQAGALLELRFGAAIRAPKSLRRVNLSDRPYAAALSLGLHTHFQRQSTEFALGADMVVTGPQTGLGRAQMALHEMLDHNVPRQKVLDRQIGNGLHGTLVAEVGREMDLGRLRLRPFAEARLGAETLLRVGGDLTFGDFGKGALMVRDEITGHRYRAVASPDGGSGPSLLLGADMAVVESSIYLPENRGLSLTDTRDRLRMGVAWETEDTLAYYGLTWLGKEFSGQSRGQLVGSLRLAISF